MFKLIEYTPDDAHVSGYDVDAQKNPGRVVGTFPTRVSAYTILQKLLDENPDNCYLIEDVPPPSVLKRQIEDTKDAQKPVSE